MSLQQGDEGAILVEFIYARLRGNSSNFPVVPLPCSPDQACPCIGFSIMPMPSAPEQGGDILYSPFQVNVMVIGQENVDSLEPLRAAAKEIAANLRADSSQPGTQIADGIILSCRINMPITFQDRDPNGVLRWHHGHQWTVLVQPDIAAN